MGSRRNSGRRWRSTAALGWTGMAVTTLEAVPASSICPREERRVRTAEAPLLTRPHPASHFPRRRLCLGCSGAGRAGAGEGGAPALPAGAGLGAAAPGDAVSTSRPREPRPVLTTAIPQPANLAFLTLIGLRDDCGPAAQSPAKRRRWRAGEASDRALTRFNSDATSIIDCQRSAGFLRRQRAMRSANSAGMSGAMDGWASLRRAEPPRVWEP